MLTTDHLKSTTGYNFLTLNLSVGSAIDIMNALYIVQSMSPTMRPFDDFNDFADMELSLLAKGSQPHGEEKRSE